MSQIITAVISGSLGAIISGWVVFLTARKSRAQTYYHGLINHIETHNWNLLSNHLKPGLPINGITLEVRVVCYQHLNLLFYVWLNKDVIQSDGTIEGWKNWATAIVKGAEMSEHKQFKDCYRNILSNKDLYPKKFITWLDKNLGLSTTAFYESH